MDIDKDIKRENVLIEALPYFREFHDSLMVIKIGGHAMVEKATLENIVKDVVLLRYVGINPIVVHGGGPEISEKMEKMGKKPEFVSGLRITDEETLEIARMVLIGNINWGIVSLIGKHGARGIGLSGKDGGLIIARKIAPQEVLVGGVKKAVDLGWVGETEHINPEILMITTGKGYIPVIAPIGADREGRSYNLNADTVAGDIAAAIRAKKLITLTDVPGILRDPDDPESLISQISLAEAHQLLKQGIIKGGMIPKLKGCMQAVEAGVEKVHIINGNVAHALLLELFTDTGIGTMVYRYK